MNPVLPIYLFICLVQEQHQEQNPDVSLFHCVNSLRIIDSITNKRKCTKLNKQLNKYLFVITEC